MDWNIVFFEIALVSLLITVAVPLFVVLSAIKATLVTLVASFEKVIEN